MTANPLLKVTTLLYRYQDTYEQKLDPFSNFSKQEKQRKYGQLSVFEKVTSSKPPPPPPRPVGDPVPRPLHRQQQDGSARGLLLLGPPSRPRLRRALQTRADRIVQTRHGGQVLHAARARLYTWYCRWHEKYVDHMEHVHAGEEHVG